MQTLFLYALLTFLVHFSAFGQQINPRLVTTLPDVLVENSGLEISAPNRFWTHNDGGGEASLYAFDSLGNLIRTLAIDNATNIDWEDLTQDQAGNLYIGDFGNNENNRKNLHIYKIPPPASATGISVSAEVINFTYANQQAFPPSDQLKNFDMEAMIAFNDSLYLFSKNRTSPFSGYTYLYRLPAKAGTYTAALVDSFFTGTDELAGQITAADISPDQKTLVLLSYGRLFVFTNFSGSAFFAGNVTTLSFGEITQKESICFDSNCAVYITDETFLTTGRKLYYQEVCSLTTGLTSPSINPAIRLQAPFPNPASDYLVFAYQLPPFVISGELVIHSINGTELKRMQVSRQATSIRLPAASFPEGIYTCTLQTVTGNSAGKKFIIAK